MSLERINKFLRNCGVSSRRKAEQIIVDGRVSINGIIVKDLSIAINPDLDIVKLDNLPLTRISKNVYYMLHKPRGFLCTHKKRPNELIVYDILPQIPPLFSIGRLDKESTGLLLLTNDGTFAQKVIHPSSGILKEYVVTLFEKVLPCHIDLLYSGTLIENTLVVPRQVEKISPHSLKILIGEGKKREVRLLIKKTGLHLTSLIRTAIGSLRLDDLPLGKFTTLSEKARERIFQ